MASTEEGGGSKLVKYKYRSEMAASIIMKAYHGEILMAMKYRNYIWLACQLLEEIGRMK